MKISIPNKYIKKLSNDIVINRGIDGCLWLYNSKKWKEVTDRLNNLFLRRKTKRHIVRFANLLLDGALKAQINKDRKITIPDHLKDYANIKKKVIFIELNNQVELWAAEEFGKYLEKYREELNEFRKPLNKKGE